SEEVVQGEAVQGCLVNCIYGRQFTDHSQRLSRRSCPRVSSQRHLQEAVHGSQATIFKEKLSKKLSKKLSDINNNEVVLVL
ncbi:hypothetical protein KQX54_010449, partial [Cotesia glomerata]